MAKLLTINKPGSKLNIDEIEGVIRIEIYDTSGRSSIYLNEKDIELITKKINQNG